MTERSFAVRSYLLLAITVAVLFSFLGSARLWDRDEPRNARAAQEMLERNDWIVPTFNGELRSHKPVMLYWLEMTAYKIFGRSEFAARLPSALAAIVSVMTIAWLASRLAGEGRWLGATGFWTGAALATCTLFVMAGRAATPDGCLIAFSTLGIAALVGGLLVPPAERSRLATSIIRERLSWQYALIGYGALGGALLTKGPVGLVLPLLIVHSWWVAMHRERWTRNEPFPSRMRRIMFYVGSVLKPQLILRSLTTLKTIPGVALAIAIAAPWYIAVGIATDGQFVEEFFWRHNVARAVSSMEGHNGGFLFYPVALMIGTFPWSLWLIPIAWWGLKAKRRGAAGRTTVTLAAVWMGVTIIAFSFARTKLPSYITSCYPGVALIIGGFLKDFAADIRMPSRAWRTVAGAVALFVAMGLATGLIWFSVSEELPLVGWVGCSSLILAIAGACGWIVDWQERPRWVPVIWLTAAVLLHIGLFGIGTRTVDKYRSEVDMLVALDDMSDGKTHWYGVGGIEPSWIFYLNKPVVNISESLAKNIENREAWIDYIAQNNIVPGDHLIVEGDYARRLTEATRLWSSQASPLIEQGRTERFLRSGEVVVYQIQGIAKELARRPGDTVR